MRARTRSHEKSENNQFVFSSYKFQAIRQLTLDFSFNSEYPYMVCCCVFHMPSRLADDEIIPDNVDCFIYIQGARILLKKRRLCRYYSSRPQRGSTHKETVKTISLFASFCFRARAPEAQTKSERDKSLVLEI